MSFNRNGKQIREQEIESMKIAVDQYNIRAIHPDKMEDFAEYLVQKLKDDTPDNVINPKGSGTHWRKGGPLED
jgi:hypothetical protein